MLKFGITFSFLFIVALFASIHFVRGQAHHTDEGFINPFPGFENRNLSDLFQWAVVDRIRGKRPGHPAEYNFPSLRNDGDFLRKNKSSSSVTWIGHSTLLIQLDGLNILTDPIWSERASLVSFAGPKRYMPPGLAFDALPEIDLVLISHDHYDHLDKATIKKLGNKPFYIVPLGLGPILESWGISHFQELDWWDEIKFNSLRIICTPAQHFSGRSPFKQNNTLWASWTLLGKDKRIYFGGDSGYFPGYKEIGRRFGPFDLAALPIGAYKPRWFMKPVHMSPAEALKAFEDLQGRIFIPIHWGTFNLADEPLDDPPRRLRELIKEKDLDSSNFWILKHGETHVDSKLISGK